MSNQPPVNITFNCNFCNRSVTAPAEAFAYSFVRKGFTVNGEHWKYSKYRSQISKDDPPTTEIHCPDCLSLWCKKHSAILADEIAASNPPPPEFLNQWDALVPTVLLERFHALLWGLWPMLMSVDVTERVAMTPTEEYVRRWVKLDGGGRLF